jgi:hypothetical protein
MWTNLPLLWDKENPKLMDSLLRVLGKMVHILYDRQGIFGVPFITGTEEIEILEYLSSKRSSFISLLEDL